ncbi:long-chain-fatty-acid--CoA ligase [Pseudomonas zhanjiangensis]|uniref:Long-chain-fatty-acid--CoA ligase n=1 Tax=Pseudomonas zhanjiangensis TaxID=3239015 RepID=A0ABV3YT84_9PSED
MDKVWLESYPQGVAAEIDCSSYRSLAHLMEEAFHTFAPRTAYSCMGTTLSYAELDRMSAALAAWLQSKGLVRGSRVAIMLPNILQYPVVMAAVVRGGYTVVNVNPLYTPRELEHQLVDSGAQVLFVLENFAHTVEQVLANTPLQQVVVASAGDLLGVKGALVNLAARHLKKMVARFNLPKALRFTQVMREAAGMRLKDVQIGHDDIAFLQYTGGTTGASKGAVLLHRNVVANVLQNEAWFQPTLADWPRDQGMTIVCALPLYHVFALTVCALMGLRLGASNILIPNPRDMPGFVRELKKHRINIFPGVNTLYNGLLNQAEFAGLDFSALKACTGGGMAVQKAVSDRWQQVTGVPIVQGYGLSETSAVATCNPCGIREFAAGIGLPLPSTEIAILDEEGRRLAFGEAGEIAIRGPQVMAGYWQREDDTAQAMTADGFFRTGDIGIMDSSGRTRIVDRKKDMILVSGFNVYPNEIEAVIAGLPGVLECACVGVPDPSTGEAVKVFVVRKDQALTAEQVFEHCKRQLTGYKKPKYVEFRDELPKTNVGKILRRALREPA